ncbi:hypothetical protein T492DRAFT_1040947 [Pavlovales sp. CCMP2436]|nr:hypothetical protein T492DRAFT_1040947 [Pavlovales sp. CCMP2436]
MAAAVLAEAEAKLSEEPFDLRAWEAVLSVADASPLVEGRPLYERFLHQFPCAAAQWKALIDSELRARDFASAEAHLGASLRSCPHLGLWSCYISFVRLTTNDDTAKLAEAYELLLDTVGLDVGAVPHWLDYISLLKARARTEPKLVVQVRAAYQRALVLPLSKLDVIWKEYEAWELLMNRTLGRQLVAEWKERHTVARRAGKDRAVLRTAAPLDAPGRPPCAEDSQLLAHWRAYLDFELGGAFQLPPADQAARATLAIEQALLPLRHFSEVYHLAALSLAKQGQLEAARSYWRRGADVSPDCPLLPLAEAEFEERAGNLDGASDAYERLVRGGRSGPLGWVHALRFTRRTKGTAAARALFARARRAPSSGWQVYAAAATLEAAAVPDGSGAEAEACAQVAINIFEKGLAPHGADLRFVHAYADFLRARARLDELRALYERTLARVDAEDESGLGAPGGAGAGAAPTASQVQALWDAFIDLERELGSIAAVRELELRRAARHPETGDPLSAPALALRFRFGGLFPCSADEAALLGIRAGVEETDPTLDAGAEPALASTGLAAGGAVPADGGGAHASTHISDRDGEREARRVGRQDGARTDGRARGRPQGADDALEPAAPLGEVESMLLARQLNAPEQLTLLLAALPAPSEFAGPKPTPTELSGILEVLVQLPPNLHSLLGTAVRMFGGSMNGVDPAAGGAAAPTAFVSAGAVEPSGAGGAGALASEREDEDDDLAAAAPAPSDAVKAEAADEPPAEEEALPETLAPPARSEAAAPAAQSASPADSDNSDSDDGAAAFAKRKRAGGGGSDLYLQRLQKKQNVSK